MEVRVVKRGEYDEDMVRWADAIVSAGGTLVVLMNPGENKEINL